MKPITYSDRLLASPATAQVAFIVEVDGCLSLPHVIEGLGPGYDEAAVRIVQSLPRCQPATRDDGQPVAVVWQIAVSFPAN